MSEELTLDQITNRDIKSEEEEKKEYVQSEPVQQSAIPSQYERLAREESKAELVQADLDPEDFKDITDNDSEEEDDEAVSIDAIEKEEVNNEPDEIVLLTKSKEIEEEVELDEEEKAKANTEEFKKEIKQLEIFDKVSLKNFKISSQSINYNNTINSKEITKVADWVLYNENRIISMKEFKGYELNKLLTNDNSRSLSNRYRDMFTSIYDHVNSAKPATMEEWLKELKWNSLDHIYFSIYKASFSGANHIPFECPHCKKQYIQRDIPMEKMYRFKDDEVKKKVEDMLITGNQKAENKINLIQISDNYAASVRIPSIYNITLEPTVLTEEFRNKYASTIELVSYIDNIYYIDKTNEELRPIDLKYYPDSKEKTYKEKIFKYGKIITQLTSDQFSRFQSYLQKITEDNNDDIEYVLPGTECPHCHKKSEDQIIDAQQLLFIRHQLTGLANSSIL